jgi:hypothetical protein
VCVSGSRPTRRRLGGRRLKRSVLQPVFETLRSNACAGAGDETFVVELGAEVACVSIRDHLAGIAIRLQDTPDQVIDSKSLRRAYLHDAVDRRPEGDVGECGNDVSRQDGLEECSRGANAATVFAGLRNAANEFEELRRAQDRIGNARLLIRFS